MGLSFFYVPERPLMPTFLIGATFSQPRVELATSGATLSQGPFLGQKQLKTVNGDLAPYS